MTVQRMDHVGIVADDLAAATDFFVELAEPIGEAPRGLRGPPCTARPYAR